MRLRRLYKDLDIVWRKGVARNCRPFFVLHPITGLNIFSWRNAKKFPISFNLCSSIKKQNDSVAQLVAHPDFYREGRELDVLI